jgi:hypothetical protein
MATATASSTSSAAAASGQGGTAASGGDNSGAAQSEGGTPLLDDSRLTEPRWAERRKSNQLENEIRTLRQQLNCFSEINPEEYARLKEAERQKQVLEERMELRERQMERAFSQMGSTGRHGGTRQQPQEG